MQADGASDPQAHESTYDNALTHWVAQAEMRSRGYFESMIHDDDSCHNEVYTNRIKCLKHNARAAVVLKHQTLQQSFLLADVVGATVAGLAMCLAIGGIYLCYRFSR